MSPPTPRVFEIHPGIHFKGRLSMENDILLTGKFEGDLQTFGSLTVAPGGEAIGTIEVTSLVLEPGNLVTARVKVGAQTRPKPPADAAKAVAHWWTQGLAKIKQFALGRK